MNLAIIGGGEMAEELFHVVTSTNDKNKYEKIYFVDLFENKKKNTVSEADFFRYDNNDVEVLIAMGEPSMRRKMMDKYLLHGFKLATFVHPFAYVAADAKIGNGSIILPYVYIAQNVIIGNNVLLHAGVKIENDCVIEDNCFVNGNAFIGAKTRIENTCFIGPSSTIRDSLIIGNNSIIGMGSVVTKDVSDYSVCVGNPAKKIRENTTHKVFK